MRSSRGGLRVEPETVVEGGEVEVEYDGAGPLYYAVDNGEWQEIPIDPKSGKAKVKAPVGASVMAFSDLAGEEAFVEVFSSSTNNSKS